MFNVAFRIFTDLSHSLLQGGNEMRSRNENSRYRQKRGEAQAGNLEKKYGSSFGVHSELKMNSLKKQSEERLIVPPHEEEHKS